MMTWGKTRLSAGSQESAEKTVKCQVVYIFKVWKNKYEVIPLKNLIEIFVFFISLGTRAQKNVELRMRKPHTNPDERQTFDVETCSNDLL